MNNAYSVCLSVYAQFFWFSCAFRCIVQARLTIDSE